jgi:hypothetical protein
MKIDKLDSDTFDVQSSTDPTKKYMVWHENLDNEVRQADRWLCECKWWTIHCKDSGESEECKHIKAVKKKFIKS